MYVGFLAFKYVFIDFAVTNLIIFQISISDSSVQNNLFDLCV